MRILLIKISYGVILFSSSALANPIHQSQSIKAGNILQWIKMDGENDQHPILLFLHGGPGNSVMGYAHRFTSELQKYFIVVQWDQRETGKTKALNSSLVPLTVSLFESDAVEVMNYLRDKFHKDKIYLVGHSWGGFLAIQVAAHHPELLAACFAAAPMVHQVESETLALTKMKEIATREKNTKAMEELAEVKIPFENGRQLFFHRRWLHTLLHHENPGITKTSVEKWALTWLALLNKASEVNLAIEEPEIKCPIYFLIGVRDYQTNAEITKTYYEKLKAPKKDLFWFRDSAHALNLTESKKFQEVIISACHLKN
jgi:pimeloyl-ACP methyl ester carboxylesterase